MRSASYSFSRVKLIWLWMESADADAAAADAAWPLPERAAAMATANAASDSNMERCWPASERAMWCCVTWLISWASTAASSDSDCVSRINPTLTPT